MIFHDKFPEYNYKWCFQIRQLGHVNKTTQLTLTNAKLSIIAVAVAIALAKVKAKTNTKLSISLSRGLIVSQSVSIYKLISATDIKKIHLKYQRCLKKFSPISHRDTTQNFTTISMLFHNYFNFKKLIFYLILTVIYNNNNIL